MRPRKKTSSTDLTKPLLQGHENEEPIGREQEEEEEKKEVVEHKEEKEEVKAHPAESKESKLLSVAPVTSVDRIIVYDAIIEDTDLREVDYLDRDVSDFILRGEFGKAIQKLCIDKDLSKGIISSYRTTPKGYQVLIRDARERQANTIDTYHDWAIMGINYASAAIKLLQANEIPEFDLKDKLISDLNNFLDQIKESKDAEIDFQLFVNQKIIPAIIKSIPESRKKEFPEKKIREQLAEVRDFCNFDHPTISVATKTKVTVDREEKEIYQIDIPVRGDMSDTLTKDLKYLVAITKGGQVEKRSIAWFDTQKPHIQFLIKKHAQDVLDGKMIPTQLRKYFPGIRNAGEEFIVDITNGKNETIQHHYHSGTPAHLLKSGKQKATNESIKQLEKSTGAEHVFVLTLLSPLRGPFGRFTADAGLVKQVERGVKEANRGKSEGKENFHVANVPLNFIRGGIASRQMSGADWLVSQARKELKQLEDIDDFAKITDRMRIISNLEDLIQKYDDLRSGSGFFWDPENRNLQLVAVLNQMAHAVNEVHRINTNETKPFVAVVFSCQSGKDRAGLARIKTAVEALRNYLSPKESSDIEKVQANAGHVAAQAGFQGGTMGASGIKKDSLAALPASWKELKGVMFKKTASYNKGVPKDPRKSKKWFKTIAAIIGLVIGAGLCATGIGALVGAPLIGGITVASIAAATGIVAANAIVGTGIGVGVIALGVGIQQAVSARRDHVAANRYAEFEKNRGIKRQGRAEKKAAVTITHTTNTINQQLDQAAQHQAKKKLGVEKGREEEIKALGELEKYGKSNPDIKILKRCISLLADTEIAQNFKRKIKEAKENLSDNDRQTLITEIESRYNPSTMGHSTHKKQIREIIAELRGNVVEAKADSSQEPPRSPRPSR